MLGRLAGRTAQEVMTYMTIPSTISGGPSIFQVHLGSGEVLHAGDVADVLVAFYQHSYDNHLDSLKDGGICLYDSEKVEETRDERGIHHIGVPFTSATVEAIGGTAKDRGKNIFVLGLICSMFNLDREKLTGIIERQFGRKGEDVLRNCMNAFDAGYAFQTIGMPPPVPVVVSIDVDNKPVIDVLRSIGLQLGVRGDVRVDGRRKMVEIHYAPSTGIGESN